MGARRISVYLSEEDDKALQWIIDCTGSNMSDAVRTALDIVNSSGNDELISKHYLEIRKRDRAKNKPTP